MKEAYNLIKKIDEEYWKKFRNDFILDPNFIHLSLAIQVSHSIQLNKEIDKYRSMIDKNPDLMRRERHFHTGETITAAAKYLNTSKDLIALTESSTMAMAIVLNGFIFKKDDEIITTDSEHYSLEKLCEYNAVRQNLSIKKFELSKVIKGIKKEQIINGILDKITDKTKLIAISWVNSKYGLKMPIKDIAKKLKKINFSRSENEKILFCVDGVHGFGVEAFQSIHELDVDYFAAGCHKWLFGPRGTAILWASEKGWKRIEPTIPSFEKIAWDIFLSWENKKFKEEELLKSKFCTPGGFKNFEYIWALKYAFENQEKIGKINIYKKIKYLADICKKELIKIKNLELITPLNSELSSGFICFNFTGIEPSSIVKKMYDKNIIIGQSPYKDTCLRITPSIFNTEEEIITACNLLRIIIKEIRNEKR
ncbi:aminotransferase class V-fold PLP-dependent enzyme [Pigmentibacter sp. JX0631]|uniref:aminotransferase class V-fold PLP-dependent enzyme n=1 Tax=Pigmentibacter sp. JX0631 TaxID=2976982 RepID=UPI002468DFE1|nr:aminotransferase class V-fold PLP-dependent enzyme [Pigmentibacter sp. JX0631]WGL60883.1 aminotransferase class V-fold PLP-dependent enzyme [Pigmentibacter sp. JX0631]